MQRPVTIADAPSRHRICLGKAVEVNQLRVQKVVPQKRMMPVRLKHNAAVYLVAQKISVGILGDNLGNLAGVRLRQHRARRIRRTVHKHKPRLVTHALAQRLGTQREAVFLLQRNGHGLGAVKVDRGLVDRKERVGQNDLRARLGEHQDREPRGGLSAGRHDEAGGVEGVSGVGLVVFGERLAERCDADGVGVSVGPVAGGACGGVLDVWSGREVGLSDAEHGDVGAVLAHLCGFGEHL